MSKIKIKNFGPIKEGYQQDDGYLDIKKVTVFIGNQGSGKSTVAKAIASMVWLEKALNRGDVKEEEYRNLNAFHHLFGYLRLGKEYFREDTEIEYHGDLYKIRYCETKQWPMIEPRDAEKYAVPKIMYVPAERTFLSAVEEAFDVKGLPPALFEFAEEFRRSQKELRGAKLPLPIEGFEYFYDERNDRSFVIGADHKVDLLEASSGFQSLIPLFVVSGNLANMIASGTATTGAGLSVDQSIRMNQEVTTIMADNALSDEEKVRRAMSVQAKYRNEVFFNIVEEPEQNLFPSSQKDLLFELLRFNNLRQGNKLVMTTHSPYLINYLTLAVKAGKVNDTLTGKGHKLSDPGFGYVNAIVPMESTIKASDLAIYELDESDGTIRLLPDYKGLPSDENYLNADMEDSNELFAQLQEIEKGWR